MDRVRAGLVGLVCALALAACGGSANVPDNSFYRLDVAAPAAAPRPSFDGVLQVEVTATAPIYRDRSLLYSEAGRPGRLQRYHYHHWIDSPPRLLEQRLAGYLRAAAVASSVVTPADRLDAAYELRVDIERFEHLRASGGGEVLLDARVVLISRGDNTPQSRGRVSSRQAVGAGGFDAVTAAYERGAADLFTQILQLVGRH